MAISQRVQGLLSQASENDWIILQDMTEKTAGNHDNSQLLLSLDDETALQDNVYVVHYSLDDVGELDVRRGVQRSLLTYSRFQEGQR